MDIKEKIIIEFWRDFENRLQWKFNTNKITKEEFNKEIKKLDKLVESRLKENRDFEINKPIRIQEYIYELHKKALINTFFIIIIFILFITIYKLIN